MNDETIILNLTEKLLPQAIEMIKSGSDIVIPDLIGKDFYTIKNSLSVRDVHGDYLSEKFGSLMVNLLKKEFPKLRLKYFKMWGHAGSIRIIN